MGRSHGRQKKIANVLLSGSDLKMNSKRADIENFLLRLNRLRKKAVADGKTSRSPEVFDLKGRNMSGLDLFGLNLSGSQFKNVDFNGSVFSDQQKAASPGPWGLSTILTNSDFEQVNFNRADLGGVNLNGANIKDSSFVGADLTGLQIIDATIEDSSFYRANLDFAWIRGVDFREDVGFKGATIKNTYIRKTDLSGLDFDLVEMKDVYLVDSCLNNIQLQAARIERVNVTSDHMKDFGAVGADFFNADINSLYFEDPVDLTGASFQSARVEDSNFKGSTFYLANFENAFFEDCVFDQCKFDDALLAGARFKNCSFKYVDLKNIAAANKPVFENCIFD